eukprot:2587-Rhodomonas_salina.1
MSLKRGRGESAMASLRLCGQRLTMAGVVLEFGTATLKSTWRHHMLRQVRSFLRRQEGRQYCFTPECQRRASGGGQ